MNIYGSFMDICDEKNKDIYVEKQKHYWPQKTKIFLTKKTNSLLQKECYFSRQCLAKLEKMNQNVFMRS